MLFDTKILEKLAENDKSIQFMINMSEGEDRISKLSSFFNYIILNQEDLRERYIKIQKKVDNPVKV